MCQRNRFRPLCVFVCGSFFWPGVAFLTLFSPFVLSSPSPPPSSYSPFWTPLIWPRGVVRKRGQRGRRRRRRSRLKVGQCSLLLLLQPNKNTSREFQEGGGGDGGGGEEEEEEEEGAIISPLPFTQRFLIILAGGEGGGGGGRRGRTHRLPIPLLKKGGKKEQWLQQRWLMCINRGSLSLSTPFFCRSIEGWDRGRFSSFFPSPFSFFQACTESFIRSALFQNGHIILFLFVWKSSASETEISI